MKVYTACTILYRIFPENQGNAEKVLDARHDSGELGSTKGS